MVHQWASKSFSPPLSLWFITLFPGLQIKKWILVTLIHHHHPTSLMTDYLCNYKCVTHYRQVMYFMKWWWHNTEFGRSVDLEVRKSDYNEFMNATFCPIQEYSMEYLQQKLKDNEIKQNSQDYNNYLHIRNMNNFPILVFCLYCNNSWPTTSDVILIQNQ